MLIYLTSREKLRDKLYYSKYTGGPKLISGQQDGVYYLTLINASNNPSISPFTDRSFAQPVTNLFPQRDKDTPASDPDSTKSFAVTDPIGNVVVNDVKKASQEKQLTNLSWTLMLVSVLQKS